MKTKTLFLALSLPLCGLCRASGPLEYTAPSWAAHTEIVAAKQVPAPTAGQSANPYIFGYTVGWDFNSNKPITAATVRLGMTGNIGKSKINVEIDGFGGSTVGQGTNNITGGFLAVWRPVITRTIAGMLGAGPAVYQSMKPHAAVMLGISGSLN